MVGTVQQHLAHIWKSSTCRRHIIVLDCLDYYTSNTMANISEEQKKLVLIM
jgi:adenosyl cobinamide kinase/adenosyl cobinamide phosphate guanylyltransferase